MSLFAALLAQARDISTASAWGFSAADCEEFAEALLPWMDSDDEYTNELLAQIIDNFYRDGATVLALADLHQTPVDTTFMKQWSSFMQAVVRNRFGVGADLVEDIVQESWMDLLNALGRRKYRFRSRLKTFVYSVVIHRGLNTLRQERSRRWDRQVPLNALEDSAEHMPLLHDAETPAPGEEDWINGEVFALVEHAIEEYCRQLRNGQIGADAKRELARLVFLKDEPLQSAAEQLGLNYNSAMTIIRRIRLYLRQIPELRELHE